MSCNSSFFTVTLLFWLHFYSFVCVFFSHAHCTIQFFFVCDRMTLHCFIEVKDSTVNMVYLRFLLLHHILTLFVSACVCSPKISHYIVFMFHDSFLVFFLSLPFSISLSVSVKIMHTKCALVASIFNRLT